MTDLPTLAGKLTEAENALSNTQSLAMLLAVALEAVEIARHTDAKNDWRLATQLSDHALKSYREYLQRESRSEG